MRERLARLYSVALPAALREHWRAVPAQRVNDR